MSLFSATDHLSHLPNGKAVQIAGDLRALNDALLRFRAIGVDPAEFACLKAIVLFKSGEYRKKSDQEYKKVYLICDRA